MPKVKSVSGAKKRFRKTASGKFKLNHANKSHILTKKTSKRLRKLRRGMMADHANLGALKRMLPYA